MKNKFTDLHNHLFMEIERLGDEDLKGEELTQEIVRAKAICDVAGQIIANGKLVLDASVAVDQAMGKIKIPLLLE
jgi:hypothetical protein